MSRYKTTRPIIPLNADREVIEATVNDNIKVQLRRYELSDLPYNFRLRTQAEVMRNTAQGLPDEDMETTLAWMNQKLPPNDKYTFVFAIWARQSDDPWEHIGSTGCHRLTPVPHLGYMIRTEWWGKSVVTTVARTLLQAWWALPRVEVELSTEGLDAYHLKLAELELNQDGSDNDREAKNDGDRKVVPEILLAEIEENNEASRKIAVRCGFKYRNSDVHVEESLGSFTILNYTLTRPQ